MRKYVLLMLGFVMLSCNLFKEKHQYTFVYGFNDEENIFGDHINKTINVIKKRLDYFGFDFEVSKQGNKNIHVKIIAYELDDQRINNLILNEGKLEFWELYKGEELYSFFSELNVKYEENLKSPDTTSLFDRIVSMGYQGGPIIFNIKVKDTALFNEVLHRPESRFLLTYEYKHTKFLWGIPDSNNDVPLYVAKSNKENKPPLTGESIIEAVQVYDVVGRPSISIIMDRYGAITWERITGKAFNNNTCIAITLNGLVYSAPGVTSGPIKGGMSEISGDFTLEQAQDLANVLSSHAPIPKLELLQFSKSE